MQDPLFQAILDDPDDDSRRLVYADWLEELASVNRTTLAGLFDQALTEYAEKKGFRKPPERTP